MTVITIPTRVGRTRKVGPVPLSTLSAEVGRKMAHLQRTCGVILALAMLTAFPCAAQNRVSLDVGSVTVWLGMPRTEVLTRLTAAGYKITDVGNNWTIVDSFGSMHDLRFRDGKVIYADREWYVSKDTDEAEAVIGALGTLAEKSKTNPCAVSHEPLAEPTISADRVFVSCGRTIRANGELAIERSVLISQAVVAGKKILSISERIGVFPSSQ